MGNKVLLSETRNNGYGCGCCGKEWTDEEWIDENEMMSFEALVHRAFNVNPLSDYGDFVDITYYDENEHCLYGYALRYGKDYCKVYIDIGEEHNILIKQDNEVVKTKEQLVTFYKELQKK